MFDKKASSVNRPQFPDFREFYEVAAEVGLLLTEQDSPQMRQLQIQYNIHREKLRTQLQHATDMLGALMIQKNIIYLYNAMLNQLYVSTGKYQSQLECLLKNRIVETKNKLSPSVGKKRTRAPVRYGGDVTAILDNWWYLNTENPYPTEQEKEELAKAASISAKQVSTWFANKRARVKVEKDIELISGLNDFLLPPPLIIPPTDENRLEARDLFKEIEFDFSSPFLDAVENGSPSDITTWLQEAETNPNFSWLSPESKQ